MAGADVRNELLRGCAVDRVAGDVVAGGKRLARTRQDDDADAVVHLRLGQNLDKVTLHSLRHPVQAVGLVEGDERDARVVQSDLEPAEIAGLHPSELLTAKRRGPLLNEGARSLAMVLRRA